MYEQIYNLTSLFFKSLKGNLMYEYLLSKFNGNRGPKRNLGLEKIVALSIYRFHFKNGDLKNYHKIYPHKVTKELARRSKSTKGWWYGFKLSGICNEEGDLENIIISYANIADCKIAEKLAECVKGIIFADAGYLQKKDALKRMEEKGIRFEAAPGKNMDRLMSRFECFHIKHRSIIESDWGTLKNHFQLEHHKARSVAGMFRHFFYCIAAYMIERSLDFYLNFFRLHLI
jgi:hypothetical protein